jgi:hypothetical protein
LVAMTLAVASCSPEEEATSPANKCTTGLFRHTIRKCFRNGDAKHDIKGMKREAAARCDAARKNLSQINRIAKPPDKNRRCVLRPTI